MSRTRWVVVAAVASVVAAAAVLLPMGLATGQASSGSFNGLKDGGYLNLHFPDANAAATFTQYKTDDSTVLAGPQHLTVGTKCTIVDGSTSTPADPQLATLSSSGGSVGSETSGNAFVGLGVKGKTSNGTNCGRIEPSETLTVGFGSGLKTLDGSPATGLVATAAELDIDGKGQAIVRADLYNGANAVGFALLSTAAPSGDSGPDATSGDNFAFPINPGMPACSGTSTNPTPPAAGKVCGTFGAFTSLKVSTSVLPSGAPSFALEGGRTGDPRSTLAAFPWDTVRLRSSLGTADSIFKLQQSDGTLNCGDTVQEGTIDSFTRGANNKDGSPCVIVNYDYNSTVDTSTNTKTVELLWDTGLQPAATFSLTQTWLPEDSITLPDGRPAPSKSTQVEWDPSIGFIAAPACTSSSLPSVYGTLSTQLGSSDNTISIAMASGVTARTDAFNLQIHGEVISIPPQSPTVVGGVATYAGVTRRAGDSTTDQDPYASGTKVMTTPFPIVEISSIARVAKMCLSSSSWVTTGVTGSNGLPQVQVTETILAEGDMSGRH